MSNKTWKSLNATDRAGVKTPSMIILHYTGMRTEEEALIRMCDPDSEVSAHYFIGYNGQVMQLVDDKKRAWHAGAAHWAGITDINSHSLGIEIANPGHEFGYRDFTAQQITSVIALCDKLIKKYGIKQSRVLGHSDIAPKRKEDPGELFPWKRLADSGVGLWPKPVESDFAEGKKLLKDPTALKKKFAEYGYTPDAPIEKIVTAFHRHFYPERFFKSGEVATADETTTARLMALLRGKN
jgi:N-acetylmuramoyl-L-alanine amidase